MRRRGFTVVELIVVMGIIVLILGIGVPAFNSMTRESRISQARQMLSAVINRAHIASVSAQTLTAVRFHPGAWSEGIDGDESAGARGLEDRQVAELYQYSFSPSDPTDLPSVQFHERFERMRDVSPVVLPPDLWVAPAESILDDGDANWSAVLDGPVARRTKAGAINAADTWNGWAVDAAANNEVGNFYNADDFLIVFDPRTGLQPSYWPQGSATDPSLRRQAWPMVGYDPEQKADRAFDGNGNNVNFKRPFRRFNFTGVITYRRDLFMDILGRTAASADRQAFLRKYGNVYHVNRNGGSLIDGRKAEEE